MKNIYLSLLICGLLFASFTGFAQSQSPSPFLSIGPEFGLETRANYKFGVGGSLKFGLPVSQRSTITLSSGYTTFLGKWNTVSGTKSRNLHMSSLPIRAGYRYSLLSGIYLEPQVGYSRIIFEPKAFQDGARFKDFGALNYGLNLGVVKGKHWDISVHYQGLQGFKNNRGFTSTPIQDNYTYTRDFHYFGTRIAYNFSLKK